MKAAGPDRIRPLIQLAAPSEGATEDAIAEGARDDADDLRGDASSPVPPATLPDLVERVPEGWIRAMYRGRPYGLHRTDRVGGRSVSVYAEELGGRDVISANVYRTSTGDRLRACEMPDAKVLAFLRDWRPA